MSDSLTIAAFLVLAMSAAGVVHIVWLRWATADALLFPVDFGKRIRGRRLFGDNKRLRGFIVLPLAAAGTFALVAAFRQDLPATIDSHLWNFPVRQFARIGFVAGLAFMLAELPNSFLKRQLGLASGEVPRSGFSRIACLLLDRFDSAFGMLLAVSLMAPVPPLAWLWVLLIGPGAHALFSALLFRMGVKERIL
jgi:CDP-2,3-bis-(O-geranylgeranyl)-sn-glycerol synthase